MSDLKFSDLRSGNVARLPVFKNKKGEPAHSSPDGSDWTMLEWAGAAAGELGELANVVKKVRRGDLSLNDVILDDGISMRVSEWIAREAADVVCYLDILVFRAGEDLGHAVQEKFNHVSERVGCDIRIPLEIEKAHIERIGELRYGKAKK